MDEIFTKHVESLKPLLRKLLGMQPVKFGCLPTSMQVAGIYMFSENGSNLYVGRSNGIRKRIGRHCRPGSTERMAAFAFRLAREETGNVSATYKRGKGSRKALMSDPMFVSAFNNQKARIRQMDIRFVEEKDPIRQALLEIYVSVVLDTPYNDFDTH